MGGTVRRIFPHVVEQDATEQLEGLFDEFVQVASLRAAQGIGFGETLVEVSTKLSAARAVAGSKHSPGRLPWGLDGATGALKLT